MPSEMDVDDGDSGHQGHKRRQNSSGRVVRPKSQTQVRPQHHLNFDLSKEGTENNILLESLIVECILNHPDLDVFQKRECASQYTFDVCRLTFAHSRGDMFTTLAVMRCWTTAMSAQTDIQQWYKENCLNEHALRSIEKYVNLRYTAIRQVNASCGKLMYMKDGKLADAGIYNILSKTLKDNICIFNGHPTLGYKYIGTSQDVTVHPESVIHFMSQLTQYAIALPYQFNDKGCKFIVMDKQDVSDLCDKEGHDLKAMLSIVLVPVTFPVRGKASMNMLEELWQSDPMTGQSIHSKIQTETDNDTFIFDRNDIENNVTIYALAKHEERITKVIHSALENVYNILQNQRFEICATLPCNPLRFIVGPGGKAEDVLFPNKLRSVLVTDTTKNNDLNARMVHTILSDVGTIEKIVEGSGQQKVLGKWGVVTFEKADDAVKALTSTRLQSNFLLELVNSHHLHGDDIYTSLVEVDRTYTMEVRICRRPIASGKAIVKITGRSQYAQVLNKRKLTIRSRAATIKPCKATRDKLILDGLPTNISVEEVHNTIQSCTGVVPNEITLDRVLPFVGGADELITFRSGLTRALDKVTDVRKVNIKISHPEPEDIYLSAELKFDNNRIATSAIDDLYGSKLGNDFTLEILTCFDDIMPSITFTVDHHVYDIMKTEVKKRIQLALKTGETIDINVNDHGKYIIKVSGANIRGVEATCAKVEEIFTPATFKADWTLFNHLSKPPGQILLDCLMKEINIYLYLDNVTKKVCVYGSKANKVKVQQVLQNLNGNLQWKMFKLDTNTVLPDAMIKIVKRYGAGLEKVPEMDFVKLNITKKTIVYCSSQNIDLKDTMKAYVLSTLTNDVGNSEVPACAICYCEIDDPENVFTLQSCGHTYCIDCAKDSVKYDIPEKRLPICCHHEECGKPVCVGDIIHLCSRFVRGGIQRLSEVIRDCFIQSNFEKYIYCSRPVCPGVVHKVEGVDAWVCPLCYSRKCTKCTLSFHKGYNCEEYQAMVSIGEWMNAAVNRRKCPSCSIGIEKVDGCNNVYCVYCHRNICWTCMAHFPDATQCYYHLNAVHGNVY